MPTQNIFISGSPALGDTVWNVWIAASFISLGSVRKIICPTSEALTFLFSGEPLVDTQHPLFHREIEPEVDLALINEHDQNRFVPSTQCISIPKLNAYQDTETAMHDPSEEGFHYLDLVEQRIRACLPSFRLMAPKAPRNLPPLEHILPKNWATKPYICINPGASHSFKRYPREHWEVLMKLLLRAGYHIVVLSGPDDVSLRAPWWYSRRLLNLQGKLSVSQSAAVVAHCDLHIAADTGFGHIASIFQIPTVTLFGSNISSSRCRPFGESWLTLQGRNFSPADIPPESVASLILGTYYKKDQQGFPLIKAGKQFAFRNLSR